MGTRTALITGASSGIGQAVAVDLARHGYRILGTSRSPERMAETLAAVAAVGGSGEAVAMEPADVAASMRALESAWERFGPIDALVNNAAELVRRPALEVPLDEWDRMLATNLKAPYFLAQTFAKCCLAASRAGAIVNVSSTHGRAVLVDRSVYGVAKAALDQMTRALAVEWAPHRIRVNAVVPATVSTPSREAAFRDPVVRGKMIARIPAGRFATEQEVAAAIRFLIAGETDFITGECLVMDGGLTLA
jgi:2-dehydro-3-deoxy-D-gluconate 5-dehydrogenase